MASRSVQVYLEEPLFTKLTTLAREEERTASNLARLFVKRGLEHRLTVENSRAGGVGAATFRGAE